MFDALVTALQALGTPSAGRATIPFLVGETNNAEPNYGTIRIVGEASAEWADDEQVNQAFEGYVDVFIKKDDIQPIKAVQDVFRACGVSFELYSIQHENYNKIVHYEWIFRLEAL